MGGEQSQHAITPLHSDSGDHRDAAWFEDVSAASRTLALQGDRQFELSGTESDANLSAGVRLRDAGRQVQLSNKLSGELAEAG